ncbi:MAG TPA: hypothetical protein PKG95_13325 [Anaerolineaceae bacterium]|nr:hypothetical protein [Anaerolineaceae bacterium]
MPKPAIPKEIQTQVETIVSEFNRAHFSKPERGYLARFRGRFLYLDRCDLGEPFQICRLTYKDKIDDWDFAIYRHSKERYDPDEWFFPGDRLVDGTIQGAMKAGLEAYPVLQDTPQTKILRTLFRALTTKGR